MPAAWIAFDSATDELSVALGGDGLQGGIGLHDAPRDDRASAALLPAIQSLMAPHGLEPRDLAAVGFGRGPGAFTGLRAACAVAQGLALVNGCPVLPLDTLSLVAEDAWLRARDRAADRSAVPDDWWIVQDARMGELYVSRLRRRAGGIGPAAAPLWTALQPAALWSPARFLEAWALDPAPGLAGTALRAGLLNGLLEGLDRPVDPRDLCRVEDARPGARALAACMADAFARGEGVAACAASPLYVRDKVAQTTAERQALRDVAAVGIDRPTARRPVGKAVDAGR